MSIVIRQILMVTLLEEKIKLNLEKKAKFTIII